MASEGRAMTQEETIQALDAAAKTREGGDSFRLRIQRRTGPTVPPVIYALFEDAQVQHLAFAEKWLPKLVGPGAGGIFELMAYHASNTVFPVGSVIRIPIDGETRPPLIDVVTQPGWEGPRALTYPTKTDLPASAPGISSGGGGQRSDQRRDSLPMTDAPPPPSRPSTVAAIADPSTSGSGGEAAKIIALNEALDRKMKEIEAKETQMREERMRSEILASVKAQTDGLLDVVKQMQASTAAAIASLAQPQAPKSDGMKEILSAAAPLVIAVIESGKQASAEQAKRMDALLAMMMQRPAMDPMVQSMLDRLTSTVEKLQTKPDAGAAMVAQMSEAMASMTNVTMQLVHTAAEMGVGGGPAPEPAWVKAVREGAKVITAMMQTQAQMALANAGRAPRPALPPNGSAGKTNGRPKPPAIDVIERAIRAKRPVDQVALAILNNTSEPSIVAAFTAAEGDMEKLFRQRLGAWLDDAANQPYIDSLRAAIGKIATERGMAQTQPDEAEASLAAADPMLDGAEDESDADEPEDVTEEVEDDVEEDAR